MIFNPARMVPLMAGASGGATQKDTMGEMADKVLDTARVAVTSLEMNQIRTAVVTEMLFSGTRKMKDDFPAFVRSNMSAQGRDAGQDHWGNDYEFFEYGDRIEIVSRGPDGEVDTDDDIWVEIPKK